MCRAYVHLACLLLFMAAAAVTVPSAADTGYRQLAKGLSYRAVPLGSHSYPAMHQVRLDPRLYKFDLVWSKRGGYSANTLKSLRKLGKAQVAINAGYFDEQNQPLGYQSRGSQVLVGSVAQGRAFTGVLLINPSGSTIVHRQDFTPQKAEVILQAGPRLVAWRKATEGLSSAPTRLSGIAIDKHGYIVLYSTDVGAWLDLQQCQRVLLGPIAKGGIEAEHVLNLDGGTSAGISISTPGFELERPSLVLLPAAITAKPRQP